MWPPDRWWREYNILRGREQVRHDNGHEADKEEDQCRGVQGAVVSGPHQEDGSEQDDGEVVGNVPFQEGGLRGQERECLQILRACGQTERETRPDLDALDDGNGYGARDTIQETGDAEEEYSKTNEDAGSGRLHKIEVTGDGRRGNDFHRLHWEGDPEEDAGENIKEPAEDEGGGDIDGAIGGQGDQKGKQGAEVAHCAGDLGQGMRQKSAIVVGIEGPKALEMGGEHGMEKYDSAVGDLIEASLRVQRKMELDVYKQERHVGHEGNTGRTGCAYILEQSFHIIYPLHAGGVG